MTFKTITVQILVNDEELRWLEAEVAEKNSKKPLGDEDKVAWSVKMLLTVCAKTELYFRMKEKPQKADHSKSTAANQLRTRSDDHAKREEPG